jgi:Transposase, Mutator family
VGSKRLEFVVADDHAGLRMAIREVLPEAVFQRCYVHFLRNALDYLPRKADDDCLQELRWHYGQAIRREGPLRARRQMGHVLSEARRLGRGSNRGDVHFFSKNSRPAAQLRWKVRRIV